MKRILKKRLRLQPVVLPPVSGSLEGDAQDSSTKALELSRRSVFYLRYPTTLGYVFGTEGKIPASTLRNELLLRRRLSRSPTSSTDMRPAHMRAGAAAR